MPLNRPVPFELGDARAAHDHVYDIEVYDGTDWVPGGRLVVLRDMVMHGDEHVHTVDYHGPNHALLIRGKADDPTFQARLNLTDCGTALVGTIATGGGAPQAVRGTALTQVYRTERQPKEALSPAFEPWDDFSISSAWDGNELKITYLLGEVDVSDRVRVSKVDRAKGETTLEMVPQFEPPFQQDAFTIVLASGNHSFTGTLTDAETNDYEWRGGTKPAPALAAARAARPARAKALAAVAAPAATRSLQDLDNISSIQVVTDGKGNQITVDFAQTTCGGYFNKCLVNALDAQWIEGIYGHAYTLPTGVKAVFTDSQQFFHEYAVLGTGQMLYDNLGSSDQYKDVLNRIKPDAMTAVWRDMGTSTTAGPLYQEASSALYIQGYRDGVALMKPYLDDNPQQWAADYFTWLTDTANLLTWQIQIASKQFDNVKTRMYEWYVKLQVLAPDSDYGKRFMTVAYSALLGVNYSKALWSEDLKPFLLALIENAIAGKVDPAVMDQVQQQAALENQELLKSLITTADTGLQLVDAIAAALTAYKLKQTLQQAAQNPALAAAVGQQLGPKQYQAWSNLTKAGKAGGLLSMLFYGASAGYLIYSIAQDGKGSQTPKTVVEELNMGILALGMLVKGIEKLMSLGVGRFLENFAAGGQGGAFRAFAGDLALWFQEGGKIVPVGKAGKAFVAVFGENSAEFMARRIGPAMAICGLVLAAFTLYAAIKSGDERDIVFESLNAFFALATVVLIGFELMSFAWAGPVGLAIAVIGVLVVLTQFIWNQIDPPKPPPDPITQFVGGPMAQRGYATA
ncbi:hypothetical protein [Amycolatopsis sp. WQ 127309]|uniref:hypothetical protein n=1 Tax=Amycolatopsis sp. WQ 127309 TaxID=2932773 RepID=UPI001FF4A029|nr:hypothetical protein [Amycolatopsis sp. WQ 127309]UOZ10656.1 hypothetical protein MUY22_21290 [Amycolatopsis sp. WQ 127309]